MSRDVAEPWSGTDDDSEDDLDLDVRRAFWNAARGRNDSPPAPERSLALLSVDSRMSAACSFCCKAPDGTRPKNAKTGAKMAGKRKGPAASNCKVIKCPNCGPVLNAVYCSEKCLKEDAKRHQDECGAVVHDPEIMNLVKDFHADRIAPKAKSYLVGGSHHEPEKRITVKRLVAGIPASKRCPLRPTIGQPVEEWDGRFDEKLGACCKPWVSFGTPRSVVLSWLPPVTMGRYPKCRFLLEMREAEATATEFGPWKACPEPHTGTVPSHVVNEMTTGYWVQFRVKFADGDKQGDGPPSVEGDARARTGAGTGPSQFSEPSDPFQVGFADCVAIGRPSEETSSRHAAEDDFSDAERAFFMTLTTPGAVQQYLDSVPMNHEVQDDTCLSALESVRQNQAHCIEGAMLGAYILSLHGHPPYMMDLRACSDDDDHIVTPFRVGKYWGCLSVSNHASLRFRNPVYRTLRELVMTYFDDYMNGKGERTLRAYSRPVNLRVVFGDNWHARRGDVYDIAEFMDSVRHYRLIPISQVPHLRPADYMILATTVNQREWQAPDNFDEEVVLRNENK